MPTSARTPMPSLAPSTWMVNFFDDAAAHQAPYPAVQHRRAGLELAGERRDRRCAVPVQLGQETPIKLVRAAHEVWYGQLLLSMDGRFRGIACLGCATDMERRRMVRPNGVRRPGGNRTHGAAIQQAPPVLRVVGYRCRSIISPMARTSLAIFLRMVAASGMSRSISSATPS